MGGRAARWSVAVWKAFAMAGSVGGMEFDYAGLRWFADLGVSNDAATAFGGTDGVERRCGDMAGARDRWFVVGLFGVMVAVIVAFSGFAPANDDTDLSPTTYNSGSAGTKGVYVLLGELGYGARRWEGPPEDLKNVNAAKAT